MDSERADYMFMQRKQGTTRFSFCIFVPLRELRQPFSAIQMNIREYSMIMFRLSKQRETTIPMPFVFTCRPIRKKSIVTRRNFEKIFFTEKRVSRPRDRIGTILAESFLNVRVYACTSINTIELPLKNELTTLELIVNELFLSFIL